MKRVKTESSHWAGRLLLVATVTAVCLPARAQLIYDNYTASGPLNEVVPDYNYLNPQGWQDTLDLSGLGTGLQISDVRVSVNISGGSNGDLYGYLRHDDGVGTGFIVLLDRPGYAGSGTGYGDPGFGPTAGGTPFVFSDAGAHEIENYQSYSVQYNDDGQLTGTWKPDTGTFSFATEFGGLNPNGTWTLFLEDFSTGDTSTVVNWGLQIEAVPEPTSVTLACLGGFVLLLGASRSQKLRRLFAKD